MDEVTIRQKADKIVLPKLIAFENNKEAGYDYFTGDGVSDEELFEILTFIKPKLPPNSIVFWRDSDRGPTIFRYSVKSKIESISKMYIDEFIKSGGLAAFNSYVEFDKSKVNKQSKEQDIRDINLKIVEQQHELNSQHILINGLTLQDWGKSNKNARIAIIVSILAPSASIILTLILWFLSPKESKYKELELRESKFEQKTLLLEDSLYKYIRRADTSKNNSSSRY